jgi:hypothetical protein
MPQRDAHMIAKNRLIKGWQIIFVESMQLEIIMPLPIKLIYPNPEKKSTHLGLKFFVMDETKKQDIPKKK